MPRRTDISSVLVIGSGPIVIGQAAEFDYSGTQACRVLKAEGLRVVLVNSNPATIMTDPEFADATYVEPITPEVVEAIIAKERPDALLATLGGQTALNTAMALHGAGVLEPLRRRAHRRRRGRHPGAGEDRQLFKEVVERIAAATAWPPASRGPGSATPSRSASPPPRSSATPSSSGPRSPWAALGSGVAYDAADLRRIAGAGLHYSPDQRGPAGGVDPGLEGVRARAHARPRGQRRRRVLDREPRPDGRPHRRLDHRGTRADPHRPGVPAAARHRHRGDPRGRCRHRRLQHPVRGEPGGRPRHRHRDEPAGVALAARWRARRPGSRSPRSPPGSPSATPWTRSPTTSPRRPRPASSRRSTTSWSRCRGSRSRSSRPPTPR